MKKHLAVCVAVLLALILSLAAGLAEDFEPQEPKEYTEADISEKFETAVEIKAGVFYHVSYPRSLEWVFYPTETGTYMVYQHSISDKSFSSHFSDKFAKKLEASLEDVG